MMQEEGTADMLSGTPIPWNENATMLGEDTTFYDGLLTELRTAVAQRVPGQSVEMREEIVQMAAVKVWRMLEAGKKERGDFSRTYLRRVAHSVFIDLIRKRSDEEPFEPNFHDVRAPETAGPQAIALGRELGREISDALGRLERSRRRAVTLHLQGHSVREIATILGWSYKRAENLVYRGLAQLREWLEPITS